MIIYYNPAILRYIRVELSRMNRLQQIVNNSYPTEPLHDDVKNQNKPGALCIVGFIGGPLSDNTMIILPFNLKRQCSRSVIKTTCTPILRQLIPASDLKLYLTFKCCIYVYSCVHVNEGM